MNRPNVLLILPHDLGRHLGAYGVSTVQSPNLDRLAAEGVRFENSFCVAPQCSPSRAALFTGRYPHNNGVMGLTHNPFNWDLHPTERHLASFLKDSGYHTALAGIQHETSREKEMGWEHIDSAAPRTAENVKNRAVAFLEQHPSDRPFYLQVGFAEPHRPFDFGGAKPDRAKGVWVPPFIKDEDSAREDFAGYQGAIRAMDGAVGEILAALDKAGLREDTLVIFTSDHGMPFPLAKCSVYDPGLHVPLIVRWPARGWTGGRTLRPMIPNIDVLPTLLETLGLPIPTNVQGRSFLPLLDGGEYAPRREIFAEMTYHDYYDPMRCIRTQHHKLIAFFSSAHGYMNPSQMPRPLCVENDKFSRVWPDCKHDVLELYDLAAEPWEKTDLSADPAHATIRDELLWRLARWMKETDDPLLAGIPPCPLHLRAVAALKNATPSKFG